MPIVRFIVCLFIYFVAIARKFYLQLFSALTEMSEVGGSKLNKMLGSIYNLLIV